MGSCLRRRYCVSDSYTFRAGFLLVKLAGLDSFDDASFGQSCSKVWLSLPSLTRRPPSFASAFVSWPSSCSTFLRDLLGFERCATTLLLMLRNLSIYCSSWLELPPVVALLCNTESNRLESLIVGESGLANIPYKGVYVFRTFRCAPKWIFWRACQAKVLVSTLGSLYNCWLWT